MYVCMHILITLLHTYCVLHYFQVQYVIHYTQVPAVRVLHMYAVLRMCICMQCIICTAVIAVIQYRHTLTNTECDSYTHTHTHIHFDRLLEVIETGPITIEVRTRKKSV
jgi:hypothetical protein